MSARRTAVHRPLRRSGKTAVEGLLRRRLAPRRGTTTLALWHAARLTQPW